MTDRLPKFEGLEPDTAAVGFTGGQEGTPPHIAAYRRDQHVAFLVIGDVGDITHGWKGGEKDRRYVRGHKIVVEKVIPLDAVEAARIYNEAIEKLTAENPRPESFDEAVRRAALDDDYDPSDRGPVPPDPDENDPQDRDDETEHGPGESDF